MNSNWVQRSVSTYEGLQVLRAVAAIAVLVTHSTSYASTSIPGAPFWVFGARGVYVFFVISGFVMALTSERLEGQPGAWKKFAINRVVRIVPLYWIALLLKALVAVSTSGLVRHGQFVWWNFITSLLFIPSYNSEGLLQPFLGPGWTINCEMFFYFFFTIGLALTPRAWLFSCIALSLFGLGGMFHFQTGTPVDFYLNEDALDFVAGVLLAKLVRRGMWLPVPIAAAVAVLSFAWISWASFPGIPRLLEVGIASVLLVFATVSLEPAIRSRVPRVLMFLGAASYVLYLFHPMISPAGPRIARLIGLPNGLTSVLISISLAIALASFVHVFIEVPLTRFFRPRQSVRLKKDFGSETVPL